MPIPTQEPIPRLLHGSHTEHLLRWSDQLIGKLEEHLKKFALPLLTKTLTNGSNNNLDIKNAMLLRITGPTGAFTITGIGGGYNGRMLFIHNATSQNLTIANESGSSAAANRITTTTDADVVGTGESSALLVYDTSRWILIAAEGMGGGGSTGTDILSKPFQSWTAIPNTPAGGTLVTNINVGIGPNIVGIATTQFIDPTNGFYYNNHQSGTVVGNPAGWAGVTGAAAQQGFISTPLMQPDVTFITATGANATDVDAGCRIWTVLYGSQGILNGDTFPTLGPANSAVGFRFSGPAGDTTWKTVSADGSTGNTINNSGVSVTANTRYVFRLHFTSATSCDFYINGALVQTHTLTLPPSNQFLLPESHIVNNTGGVGSNKNWRIRMIFSQSL